MPEFVRVWGNNGIREVPVIQGVQEVLGSTVYEGTGGAQTLLSCGIPFVLFAGNGSSAGFQFTGSAGAFTCTAISTNAYLALSGFYAYLPANFGGQTIAAGWYWGTMSSDTAGIIYTNTYTGGIPIVPASPTAFSVNLTGYVAEPITEVTCITGIDFPGGCLGPNGWLDVEMEYIGTSDAVTKGIRLKLDSTLISYFYDTTGSYATRFGRVCNRGVQNKQKNSRGNGVGSGYTAIGSSGQEITSLDLSVDKAITATLLASANTSTLALLNIRLISHYGA